MNTPVHLKEIERNVFKSTYQDGLWDIYLGILLMAFAMSAWLDRQPISENLRMGIYMGVMILAMLVLYAGKRFITIPRMGMVKFGAERQKRRKIVSLILFISGFGWVGNVVLECVAHGGDVPTVLGAMDPAIVWNEAEGFPYADKNPYVGPKAVLEGLSMRLGSEWDGFSVAHEEVHDAGDVVVATGRYGGACRKTGKKIHAQFAHVWKLRGGKIVIFQSTPTPCR